MADVLFIAILVAFFGVCVGFVRICDRVIGPDEAVAPVTVDDDTEEAIAA
jgi:hypothetical protein